MHAEPIAALRAALDRALVGQEDAKTGVLLALLAREHAYLEGPPGAGKSCLAEAVARAAGGRSATLAFHRDTRAWELVGDTWLQREPRPGGERLVQASLPGPLLRAELVVLDDIGRAPGEALGPLLRILSERSWNGQPLPLESALATALPEALDTCTDPLDPQQLDRFAIQVRMPGLLYAGRWERARRVLDGAGERPAGPALAAGTCAALHAQAQRIPLADPIRRALFSLVFRLRRLAPEAGARLSDRSFCRAALRVLRAHALLRGASRVERVDLSALRYMLARRLPELTRERFEEILTEAETGRAIRPGPPGAGVGAAWGAGGEAPARPVPTAPVKTGNESVERGPTTNVPADAEVAPILRALEGHFERGHARRRDDPGGSPRSYRPLRRLDEVFDAEPAEVMGYIDGTRPGLPRSYRRERRWSGGRVALLRDVSASMEGRLGRWAGRVAGGVVRAGARRRMRVGYAEFNHDVRRYHADGRFFHRRYAKLLGLAASPRSEGRTNYEAPLQLALDEFRGGAGHNRHIVLLTDGVPVLGDPFVRRQRTLARRLGVRVHTVFLGLGDPPPVLDAIARETGGLCFVGRPSPAGELRVLKRGDGR